MKTLWTPPATIGYGDWSRVNRRSAIVSAQVYAGTTSTLRIVNQLAKVGNYAVVTHGDEMWNAGTPEKSDQFIDYKPYNEIYYWRTLNVCMDSLTLSRVRPDRFRFIVTFRDPRDVFVSMFNNAAYDHPLPLEPDHRSRFLVYREQVRQMGMDAFAMTQVAAYRQAFFVPLGNLYRQVPRSSVVTLSYARLCLDLPGFLAAMIESLDLTPTNTLIDHMYLTEDVRQPDRMSYSACHFPRASPLPGRFRRELQPATIASLNAGLADILAWMREADPDFAETYQA